METKEATGITETEAALNGVVNPRGTETKYYFEYGTSEAYGSKTSESSAGSGTTNLEESKAVTGLSASTTYDYRIVAMNSHGTADGANHVLSTTGKPTVETKTATSIGENGATLNGMANPRGASTKYYFEYGTTLSYGSKTSEVNVGSGTSNVEVSKAVAGLLAGTEYHFRIVATNSHGTADGADHTFTTSPPSWSVLSTPNPSGAEASSFGGPYIGGTTVSCASVTACTGVGHYKNSADEVVTMAERWNGTEWAVEATPNPSGAKDRLSRRRVMPVD